MSVFDDLLCELEDARDLALKESRESRTRAETYEIAAIKLRNAIAQTKKDSPDA